MQEACRVFISYRNDQYGGFLAQLLKTKLESDGYRPFYAPESMKSGKFDEQLFHRLDECSAVIAVLSPHALDEREGREDWMRIELAYAIRRGVTVIPVMAEGFRWPEEMPESLAGLDRFHGVAVTDRLSAGQYMDLTNLLDDALGIVQPVSEMPVKEEAAPPVQPEAAEARPTRRSGFVTGLLQCAEVLCAFLLGLWNLLLLLFVQTQFSPTDQMTSFVIWLVGCAVLLALGFGARRMADRRELQTIVSGEYLQGLEDGKGPEVLLGMEQLAMQADALQKHLLQHKRGTLMLEPVATAQGLQLQSSGRGGRISLWADALDAPVKRLYVNYSDRMKARPVIFGVGAGHNRQQAAALLMQQDFAWESRKGAINCFRKGNVRVWIRFAGRAVQEMEVLMTDAEGELEELSRTRGLISWLRAHHVSNRIGRLWHGALFTTAVVLALMLMLMI